MKVFAMFYIVKSSAGGYFGGRTIGSLSGGLALCLSAFIASGSQARANLVFNPGFETENNPVTAPPPSWSSSGSGIVVDTGFANTGTYDVAFGASPLDPSPGTLSQLITTVPATSYNLSFAILDEIGSSNNTFTVNFGTFSATITGDQAAPGYVIENFTVLGSAITGTSTLLSFQGLNGASAWNLDDVSITTATIPEPAGASLLGVLALSGLVLTSRRRKSQIA